MPKLTLADDGSDNGQVPLLDSISGLEVSTAAATYSSQRHQMVDAARRNWAQPNQSGFADTIT